jgi:hypothetical protein
LPLFIFLFKKLTAATCADYKEAGSGQQMGMASNYMHNNLCSVQQATNKKQNASDNKQKITTDAVYDRQQTRSKTQVITKKIEMNTLI